MSNRIALVTGASRGIGAAIAQRLADDGCFVVGTATSVAGADGISARMEGQGRGLVLDVTNSASIDAALSTVQAEHGAPMVLVNNAGIARDQLLMRLKDSDLDAVIATDLVGAIKVSRACLKGMLKLRQGRIICIGSVIGAMGNAGQAHYSAAKAGLVGFARALAREVGSRGITVNVVAPGYIQTDMTAALDDAQRESLMQQVALGRMGTVDDVAGCVSFLASPAASYITGETLNVNGGLWFG